MKQDVSKVDNGGLESYCLVESHTRFSALTYAGASAVVISQLHVTRAGAAVAVAHLVEVRRRETNVGAEMVVTTAARRALNQRMDHAKGHWLLALRNDNEFAS